jgi:hypothetical protein
VIRQILAIDPGPVESAFALIDAADCIPMRHGKIPNDDLRRDPAMTTADTVAIEMVASYGMPVGAEIFDTCVWIGRYQQTLIDHDIPVELVKRLDVRLHHCHTGKAGDANVTRALIDRFAPPAKGWGAYGKGTKANPGWFHGFKADVWQSYALAVMVADRGLVTG